MKELVILKKSGIKFSLSNDGVSLFVSKEGSKN